MSTKENLKYIRRLRESDDSGVSQQSPGSKSRSDINEANKTLNQMSETTQDVAYRRKIIMDALIQSNETSLELLDNIMQDNEEEKSTSVSRSSTRKSANHSVSPSGTKSPNFSPKWNDYDIMKHRWSYLRPQTKSLTSGDMHVVPNSSDSVVVNLNCSDGTTKSINGRVNDISKIM